MLNSFKKVTAAVLSLGIIASGAGYSVADAATETVKWNAHHVNIPSASSQTQNGYVTMHATSEKYTGTVTSMSDITNRSLKLSSTTHTMSKGTIEYNNKGSRSWKITGNVKKVTYKMVARTTLRTVLNVNGTVKR